MLSFVNRSESIKSNFFFMYKHKNVINIGFFFFSNHLKRTAGIVDVSNVFYFFHFHFRRTPADRQRNDKRILRKRI